MKRLQNRIAESRHALSVTAIYALAICFANHLVSQHMWIQMALLGLCALLMVQLNNTNALIRIYSRMVSCSFLALSVMVSFIVPNTAGGIVAACFIGFFLIICCAYQDPQATGLVFYAFLCIGLASIFYVQSLFFVPILWFSLAVYMLAFSARTFVASILGLITPYWFGLVWLFFKGNPEWLTDHFSQLACFSFPFDYSTLNPHTVVSFAFVALLAIVSSIHFLNTSFLDKIRTRMIYDMLMLCDAFTLILLLLQPQWFDPLFRIAIVCTAPLTGHFIALTRTRFSNVMFFVIIAITVGITFWNLWT